MASPEILTEALVTQMQHLKLMISEQLIELQSSNLQQNIPMPGAVSVNPAMAI